jgi:hypothetical protein
MGKYLTIDLKQACTGYIHNYFGGDLFNIEKTYDIDKYNIIWFADNITPTINYILQRYFKDKTIINHQYFYSWELNRGIGVKKFEEIFKATDKIGLLKSVYYDKIPTTIEWEGKGIIKPNKQIKSATQVFENLEELKLIIQENPEAYNEGFLIQEYKEGKEVAFGTYFINSKPILPVYVNYEFKKTINKKTGANKGQSAEFGYFTTHSFIVDLVNLISEYFKNHKIKYNGYIDVNCIYVDNKLYPLEWTISRDGYPTFLSIFHKSDPIEVLKNMEYQNKHKFRYVMVLRLDVFEKDKNQEYIFELPKEYFIEGNDIYFYLENQTKVIDETNENYILKTTYPSLTGILVKSSDNFEEFNFKFPDDAIYYIDFNKELKERVISEWM